MAKKKSTKSSSPVAEVNKQKKRKKEAKREAKMMLEIEETKVDIEKAEKKLAKAQARLEARHMHLRTLEADLSEFRTSHEESKVSAPYSDSVQQKEQLVTEDDEATIVPDTGFDHQSGQPELEEATEHA